MKNDSTWTEIPGMNIASDRNAEPGEKICAFVIDSISDEILENNLFTPGADDHHRYTWPVAFAKKINGASHHIRAGEQDESGNIEPVYSQYRNKLWKSAGRNLTVFPTNCCLECWCDGGAISSAGALLPGISVVVSTRSVQRGVLYESLRFVPDAATSTTHQWPYHLSLYINRNSLFLRAGEKDSDAKAITPLYSSYRNHIWLPNGSNYSYDIEYEATEALIGDAEQVFSNALSTITGTAPPSAQKIEEWLNALTAQDDLFGDITYVDENGKLKKDALYDHLNRVKNIANYLHHSSTRGTHAYHAGAVRALCGYVREDFETENWWDRQIGLAKVVAHSILLLADHSPAAGLDECVAYLRRISNTSLGELGANQADIAYIQLFWSLGGWRNSGLHSYLNDAYAASYAISTLCLPVARHGTEEGEGISADNSFSQHNPQKGAYSQLYAGSYGMVFLGSVFSVQAILDGAFSLSGDAIQSLENFLVDGMGWFGYAGYYDFHTCGRAISRGMNRNIGLASYCQKLMKIDPTYPEILREIVWRTQGDESRNAHYVGNQAYWVNDYMSHISAKYCLWAKVISTRTVGGESGNGENVKGYYMGCGSYFISRNGKEYADIQPAWEWLRLPGTTVEQDPGFVYPPIDWGKNAWGSHSFAGVVSDGESGVASMVLTREKIKNARKSVFALPRKTVFLGSAIDFSAALEPVCTSVNQCLLHGDVVVVYTDGRRETLSLGERRRSADIAQIMHDGLCYDFPTEQLISVEAVTRTGRWSDIDRSASSELVSRDIFSVWIEHSQGQPGEYRYDISDVENAKPSAQNDAIATTHAHIVTNPENTSVAAVIFSTEQEPIPLKDVEIKALSPVAYIATAMDDGGLDITLADLSQELTEIVLEFRWGKVTSRTTFPLPDGDERGKSVSYVVGPIIAEAQ